MQHFTHDNHSKGINLGMFNDVPAMHASMESMFLLRVLARTYNIAI